MKLFDRTYALPAALALVLATNAVVFGGAWYNRSGEPDSSLRLSEREVHRDYTSFGWGSDENSALALRLDWRVLPLNDEDEPYRGEWLENDRLVELGFPPYDPAANEIDLNTHEAFLVLELDGPARQQALQRAEQRLRKATEALARDPGDSERKERESDARKALEQERDTASRLFVVDVGLDAEALRARHPDRQRQAVVRGEVYVWLRTDDGKTRMVGEISRLAVPAVQVPLQWREALDSQLRDSAYMPPNGPLELQLNYGKRLEPWISEVVVPKG